jgi:hypothetical protein
VQTRQEFRNDAMASVPRVVGHHLWTASTASDLPMSGPKGGSYQVVSAEELERRALVTAKQRYSRVRADFFALTATLSGYGEHIAEPTASPKGDSAAVTDAATALEAAIGPMKARLSDHRVKAALAAIPKVKITLNVAPASDVRTTTDRTATRVTPASPGQSRRATAADYIAQAEALVAKTVEATGGDVPAPIVAKLTAMQKHPQASSVSMRIALDDLRLAVQRHRDEAKQKQRNAKLREQVLAVLDGCEGAEALSIRRSVELTAPGAPVPVTLLVAQQVAAADTAATDAAFVQAAVVDALSDLGYEVETSMDVAVAQGGVLLEIPGHKQHAARIQAKAGQLRFNVVRTREVNSEQDDVQAEVDACVLVDQLREELSEAGVAWTVSRRDPPGARPVAKSRRTPKVTAKRTKTSAPARRRRKHRERERGS